MRKTWKIVVLSLCTTALLSAAAPNAKQELAAGLKAAESYDWPGAAPHLRYAQLHLAPADQRDRALAQILFLRSTMEQRNLAELTRTYRLLADSPVVKSDPELRLWLYIAKGDCDNDLQFPEASRRDWEMVERLASQTKNQKWKYRSKGELAIPAYYMGDLASSRKLVSEALDSASAAEDSPSVVRLLTHIGAVYVMRGGFDAGMEHLKKAEVLAVKTGNEFPATVKISQLLGLIGMGKLDDAKVLADVIIRRMHAEDMRIDEAQTRVMLGSIYQKENDLPAAIRELTLAIQISKRGNYYHSLSEAQKALGEIYIKQGQLQTASRLIASSIESMTSSGIVSDLPERLLLLAKLRTREGLFGEAEAVYKRAEDEVDAQLALTPLSTKPLVLKSTSEVYADHFELSTQHSNDAAGGYGIIERVRGRMLADLLNSQGSSGLNNDSAEPEVSALRLQLASAKTPAEAQKARDAIFFARHKRWQDEQASSPESLKRKSDTVLPLATVQRNLAPSEILIEYVEAKDSVYALVLTDRSARIAQLGSSTNINKASEQFVNAIRAKQAAISEGSALYAALFQAVPEVGTHPRLIIVPDGELYSVPFAALVVNGKRLVETHSILRAPSASTWVLLRQRGKNVARSGLLAVGGVLYNSDLSQIAKSRGYGVQLSNLPGSQEEADAASQTLGPLLKQSVEIQAQAATETAVKSALKQQREVVHLAVHGLAHSNDDPELAALVLLPDKKAGEDGMLEVPEIVRFHLRSDLVVLSACDTAVGELEGEEGVSNLSRSFLLAGAGAVASTLWSVDDVFSATLMKYFYESLAKGRTKADALEDAQRRILSEFRSTAVPWYWAGYVMEGDATGPLPNFEKNSSKAGD
jgi:CHAT domain-containing protein/tetratricopeptide (TPR) repeat protein